MNFQEAFDKVAEKYDKIKAHDPSFDGQITVEGLKAAIFAWNVVALALAEKGLDDFIYLSNNDIKSISLKDRVFNKNEKEKTEQPDTEKPKRRGRSPHSETATDETVNVEEKEQESPAE